MTYFTTPLVQFLAKHGYDVVALESDPGNRNKFKLEARCRDFTLRLEHEQSSETGHE